jgi:serine/threonine-protein kinase
MAPDDRISTLAEAVADGVDVDWADAESSAADPVERALIQQLRVLADLVQLHRSSGQEPDALEAGDASRTTPASWGSLEIREEIGSGTFGRVYKAWDARLDREVALKLLHVTRSDEHERLSPAVEEGRLLARIRHPNVVTVFGADRIDGVVGLWMEIVNGRTLKAIQQQHGPFSAQEAVVFALDICRALAAVHTAGFIHGDIKAQNVMRESGGRIVLMDFGAAGFITLNSDSMVRQTGTPLFMAPEVLEGERLSVRSDLYSLGVLLYYMVSGEFPVTGRTLAELRHAHSLNKRRLIRDVRPDLPPSFVRAIDDATAVVPNQRPESAGAMEALLEGIAGRSSFVSAAAATGVRRSEPDRRSIAVLPFVDMSPDKTLDYFCDGIADEIINALTQAAGVRVVARTSAFQFKHKAEDLRQVGSVLNVGMVLEGSVRVAGNRLRVIARLVNPADGYQLWSERFDRNFDDVFAVQDEIARAAVAALGVRIETGRAGGVPLAGGPSTRDVEAYTEYLKGRHHWNTRTERGLHKSVAHFLTAIEKDSRYADAYAALAEAQATLGLYGALAPHEVMPKAKNAAMRAIEILPTLSSPHATCGCIAGVYGWSRPEAERHYGRAIDLNPDHPAAHHWYAINHLVPLERFDEAAAELRRAIDTDPLSIPIRASVGLMSYFAHDYANAQEQLRDSLELDTTSATARLFLGLTLAETGQFDDAIRELSTAIQFSGGSPEFTAALGYVSARGGHGDRAHQALGELTTLAGRRYVSPSLIAQIHAGLGDTASALEWLERAADARAADLAWLPVRPVFDRLRSERRFEGLLEKLVQSNGG